MPIKLIHRYLSLVFAALWLLQAATGVLIVFRWDIDDAGVAGAHRPFDADAVGARLDAMTAQPDISVSSMWSANGAANRFDVFYSDHGKDRTLRIDGQGKDLRDRSNEGLGQGNIFDRLSDLHMALMLGDAGRWFIGLSGILLLTNLSLGLKMAWPRLGQWLKALRLPAGKAPVALIYGWHRMLGLWLVVPAMVTVIAGIILAYDDPIASLFKAGVPEPVAAPPATTPVKPSVALKAGLAAFPGATVSGFSLPGDNPWYRVRLHAKGEMPRIWGMTTVFVSAANGQVLSAYDARQAHAPARFLLDVAYPLHTGQIAGPAGRIVQLILGLWLMAMIGLGLSLWWTRRQMAQQKVQTPKDSPKS